MLLCCALFFWLSQGLIVDSMESLLQRNFRFGPEVVKDPGVMLRHLTGSAASTFPVLSMLFGVTIVCALLASAGFGGIHFSLKAVAPKPGKLNPLSGLKRMFGLRSLFELAKNLLKTLIIGSAVYLVVDYFLDQLLVLNVLPTPMGLTAAGRIILVATLVIASSLILIAAMDVPYQIAEFNRKLRMSKQDIKDEMKESEGRPEVRQRIRQRQREIAMSKMMKAIETADVVITNPQHFAVALSCSPGSSEAPRVVAKGVDFLAQRIREQAGAHNVPLFEAPALARALYFSTRLDDCIPEKLYVTVAEVIAYIFNLNTFHKQRNNIKRPDPQVPRSMQYSADGKRLEEEDNP